MVMLGGVASKTKSGAARVDRKINRVNERVYGTKAKICVALKLSTYAIPLTAQATALVHALSRPHAVRVG